MARPTKTLVVVLLLLLFVIVGCGVAVVDANEAPLLPPPLFYQLHLEFWEVVSRHDVRCGSFTNVFFGCCCWGGGGGG